MLGETLDVRTPPEDDDDYARVLSIKKDAAINVVSASLKADENCFRQRRTDALDRLYEAVQREKSLRVIDDASELLESPAPA